ncbi:MAG: hypothetical protein HKN23_21100, partial [Verrucomicrobiales bacterium]|nr:hypothetical protein [Verrucomicrobiales bacterium]
MKKFRFHDPTGLVHRTDPVPSFFALALLFCLPAFSQEKKAEEGPPPWPILKPVADQEPLPGTKKLTLEGDLSRMLADGCDRFLDAQIAAAAKNRPADPKRERLVQMLGLHRDEKPDPKTNRLEFYSMRKAQKAVADGLSVYHVRWRAFGDVHGDGLLLEPEGEENPVLADVIAIPDASQTPEEIAGLIDGETPTPPFALYLARQGCRVLVPTLINREENLPTLPNREWLHRPAFELGRHLIGYETQKILSGVDCLTNTQKGDRKIGVIGWSEGGLLALYSAALDDRIDAAFVAGYFGKRETLWNEPAEHNIFGLLNEFGDAEIASLVAPRDLFLVKDTPVSAGFALDENGEPERFDERPKRKGKPGKFIGGMDFEAEVQRLTGMLNEKEKVVVSDRDIAEHVDDFVELLTGKAAPESKKTGDFEFKKIYADPPGRDLIAERHAAQMAEIERHNQLVLINAQAERMDYFKDLDLTDLESFQKTIEPFRDKFRTEVIGEFDLEKLSFNARTRKYQEGPKTISYEVVLDVFDDVIAYGILTLPKDFDLDSGEKRPVVVCQHGLEGTPQDVVGEKGFRAYSAFATRLAERGFITFAPQNNYKYHDIFRIQQFKAQSIG